jgi:uncharacterized membrane protein
MNDLYPYIVAAHVTSVVFLIGGMLMHERFVREVDLFPTAEQSRMLGAILRLDRQVISPALLLTWTFELILAFWLGWFSSPWLQVKLVVVTALSALHGVQSGRLRRSVRDGSGVRSIRGAGVGIVVGMAAIATLAIVKPF